MNGPAMTMAAFPVVQRSHSSPDLFLDSSPLTKSSRSLSSAIDLNSRQHHHPDPPPPPPPPPPSAAAVGETSSAAAASGSPALELPSFDFGSGIETSLPFESKLLAPRVEVTPNVEPSVNIARLPVPPQPPMAAPRPVTTKRRSRSIVDRPKSWLTSRAASSDGSERKDKATPLRRDKKTTEEKDDRGAVGKHEKTPERRALSARDRSASFRSSSFADYARKSWIATSRSPSSSRSPSPKREGDPSRRRDSLKESDAGANAGAGGSPKKDHSLLTPHKLTRRRPTSTSIGESDKTKGADAPSGPSGPSRAFNRASVYLGKMKPQKSPHLVVPSQETSTKSENVSPAASTRSVCNNTLHNNNSHNNNNNNRFSSQTNLSSNSDTSSGGTGSTGITEPSQAPENNSNSSNNANNNNMPAQKSQPVRDPLWAIFRRLDSEYAIFLTKANTSQRVLVARNTLIPFLRNYSSSRENHALSPEDIDRRATILHKWWNGLLELLEGSSGTSKNGGGPATTFNAIQVNQATSSLQPVSGVDRPGLLELITYLMMRPEWRMCTPSFRPLKDRSPREREREREPARGRAKGRRESSDFSAEEAAEHSVRTMFVNNLLTQMALVVDKMTSRHAPASLVTFCGKACAYAFFFVPGIAEVLVRLWGLTPDLLRRIADEFGLPRRSKGESEHVVSLFPPTLHRLGWTSVKTMTDNLRLTTKLSLVAAKIPWHGPWVSRWRGADSDLLFIFAKYYYILAEDFLPAGLPLLERARAPGFALINAQLLSVLDTTIHHRQAAFENMMAPNIMDPTNGADAMAAALAQLPPSNLLRGMDENRLIALLKDMLAGHSIGGLTPSARASFATAFMAILKAATKKTPVFKQAPVLMLMDFFHEVLLAFDAYTGYTDPKYNNNNNKEAQGQDLSLVDHVDWPFWLNVFHRILFESNSTMSEIRILSFIFSAWDILTADAARKEKFCIGWLLSEQVFDKFFNNYTPMVRAYFMRLLCWRVCRDQGSPNELDMRIFSLVSDRLNQTWSHYLWLKQTADAAGKLAPSTAPCHPQPGKRFMIIRTETTPPQTGLLQTGFDTMNSTFGGHEVSAAVSAGSNNDPSSSSDTPPNSTTDTTVKKRWSIFGKMLSFSSTTPPAPGGSPSSAGGADTTSWRTGSSNDDLEAVRRATAASRSGHSHGHGFGGPPPPPPPPKGGSGSMPSPVESDASSTGSAPVYDAAQFVFKFTLGALPWNPNADMSDAATTMLSTLPRERPLTTRPRLPAPAQARVSARARAASSTGGGGGGGASSSSLRGGDRDRDSSPPPPPPGMPAPERMYSGTSQRGLITEARNAAPLEGDDDDDDDDNDDEQYYDTAEVPNSSSTSSTTTTTNTISDFILSLPEIQRVSSLESTKEEASSLKSPVSSDKKNRLDIPLPRGRVEVGEQQQQQQQQQAIRPIQPVGLFRDRATYSGRALAEWNIVVHECNSFIDRRRDEGVYGLKEVEVPSLGLENLRRMG